MTMKVNEIFVLSEMQVLGFPSPFSGILFLFATSGDDRVDWSRVQNRFNSCLVSRRLGWV